MSEKDRAIVLIRHSKRPSLHSIPYEKRPYVELTPEGIALAREYGKSLWDVISDRRIYLLHTPAIRCMMTARAIEDGLSSRGPVNAIVKADPRIKDPIVNLDRFRELRELLGWQNLIGNWLAERIDTSVLQNPVSYSNYLVKLLLGCPYVGDGDVLIVVGHDITLFPLIRTYFKRSLMTIDYMSGVVIKSDDIETKIGFEGRFATISRD